MRKLSPSQLRDLAEYEKDMEAIKRAREKGKHPVLSNPAHGPLLPSSWRTRPPVTTTRAVGYKNGDPHLLCRVCLDPAHLVARTGMCASCAAEVAWRVKLARRGLRVVA